MTATNEIIISLLQKHCLIFLFFSTHFFWILEIFANENPLPVLHSENRCTIVTSKTQTCSADQILSWEVFENKNHEVTSNVDESYSYEFECAGQCRKDKTCTFFTFIQGEISMNGKCYFGVYNPTKVVDELSGIRLFVLACCTKVTDNFSDQIPFRNPENETNCKAPTKQARPIHCSGQTNQTNQTFLRWVKHEDSYIPYADVIVPFNSTLQTCAEKCTKNKTCIAFQYQNDLNKCWWKYQSSKIAPFNDFDVYTLSCCELLIIVTTTLPPPVPTTTPREIDEDEIDDSNDNGTGFEESKDLKIFNLAEYEGARMKRKIVIIICAIISTLLFIFTIFVIFYWYHDAKKRKIEEIELDEPLNDASEDSSQVETKEVGNDNDDSEEENN